MTLRNEAKTYLGYRVLAAPEAGYSTKNRI